MSCHNNLDHSSCLIVRVFLLGTPKKAPTPCNIPISPRYLKNPIFLVLGMTFGRDRVDSHFMNTNGMPGLQSMLGQSLDPFSIFGLTRQNWYEGPSKSSSSF